MWGTYTFTGIHFFILQTSPSLTPQFRPVVDGYVLPDTPERLIQSGGFRVESVLTGATQDEGLIAGNYWFLHLCVLNR